MHSDTSPTSDFDGVARLDDWGLLRVDGTDAVTFLQGQLTQDLLTLDAASARLAGYCSPKGRLLATFVLWRGDADTVWMATSADVVEATVKRLSMFVLRAKCRVADATPQRPLWGLAGSATRLADSTDGLALPVWGRRLVAGGHLIRLPDGVADGHAVARALFVAAADGEAQAARDADDDRPFESPTLTLDRWRWLEASSGVPRIIAATSDHFVPQMVNFEVVGGVDFRKGCYPGQEVVARSQYRGAVKRRAVIVASAAALTPGAEVFHADDAVQPAGEVVLAGSRGAHDHLALVEVKRSALDAGALHAGAVGGPTLRPLPLPYPMPETETTAT